MGCVAEEALDTLTAGVLVVGPDGRVELANAGAGRVLRGDARAFVGRSVVDLLVSLDEIQAASRAQSHRPEASVKRSDGTSTMIGFSVSEARVNGRWTVLFQELDGVLVLRRERDRLLQLAALGDALPSILHELRNPLAAITSMLEVLVEETEDKSQRDLHAVLWEVRRIGLVLQGVGGVVRAAQGDQYCAVDMALREACRILEPNAQRKGVGLAADVPTLPLLPLDRGVVSGVAFNLMKNAIEACRAGNSVLLSATLDSEDMFHISVEDDGPGMSPEVLAKCQDLFFTTKSHGSGIGLALCKQIADSSGGHLEVASVLGAGTKVTLSLPLHSRSSTPPSEPR